MSYPEILTRAEVAKILRTSSTSIDRLADSGKLQKIQITPQKVGILRTELDRFIADAVRVGGVA